MDWHWVQHGVSAFATACAYDRAGFGWSDPGPAPRTSGRIADELHSLLAAARVPPPYLLVAASFGGHAARIFSQRYRDETAGLVLLDARHEGLDRRMPPAWKQLERNGKGMYQVMGWAARLGLLGLLGRVMGERAAPPVVQKLPAELRDTYLTAGFHTQFFESNLAELAAVAESDRQAAAAGKLGNLPLTVVRHGRPDLFASLPAGQRDRAEEVWQELQTELACLSTRGRLVTAGQSGHAIPIDQPELVVDTVRQMLG